MSEECWITEFLHTVLFENVVIADIGMLIKTMAIFKSILLNQLFGC